MVVARLDDEDRRSDGLGATVRTASTKRLSTALSFASPLGATSIRASPSAATQALQAGGSVSSVTGSAASRSLTWRSVVISGATSTRSRSPLGDRRRLGQGGEQGCEPARLRGGRAVEAPAAPGKVAGRLVDRLHGFGRRRRRIDWSGSRVF